MELLALILAGLLAAGLLTLFIAGFALIDAITLSFLWGWFMVPIFHLPALGLVAALGVSLVWNWLNRGYAKEAVDSKPKTVAEGVGLLFQPIFRAAFVLLIGFVVHLFLA